MLVKVILFLIILQINGSCSCFLFNLLFGRPRVQSIKTPGTSDKPKSGNLITSTLPRSKLSALRTEFNWNDFGLEKEYLEELYPPIVDVGYGSPSYMPAESMVKALVRVASNQSNPDSYLIHQYTRAKGHLSLVAAVAKFYSQLMNRNLDPKREVLITAGSLNSLDLAARAFVNPGDEIIVFEPFYFDYRAFINLNGGKIIPVPLRVKRGTTGQSSHNWTFDRQELESKITKKTKIIWINNPNNPTGKVYTLDELTFISDLAKKHDLLVLSDEAAQWYVYEDPQHIRIATIPGMFERTLTLTSGGKTFSNTGWRIGWVIAPERLIWPMASILSNAQASVATPLQIAFAMGIEEEMKLMGTPQSHFTQVQKRAVKARDLLVSVLRSVGADAINPSSGYCVAANFTKLINQIDLANIRDSRPGMRLYKYLLINGIEAYPMSLLYSDENVHQAEYSLRFTNFKTMDTLKQLGQLLPKIFNKIN